MISSFAYAAQSTPFPSLSPTPDDQNVQYNQPKNIVLTGHTYSVNSAQFSPDNKKVVTSSDDKTARLWSALTGKLLHTLTGHTDNVKSAQFSSDGKKAVTASNDKTACIYAPERTFI